VPLIDRFHAGYVVDQSGCWVWQKSKTLAGYGKIYDGRPADAHRVAYELFVGPIPSRLFVCHRCDTPSCVNPDHLFIGTHADNMKDMHQKGRARTHSLRGEAHPSAKLTQSQVDAIRLSAEKSSVLAQKHGVDRHHINNIRGGRAWIAK
jgi:hypothetical protein